MLQNSAHIIQPFPFLQEALKFPRTLLLKTSRDSQEEGRMRCGEGDLLGRGENHQIWLIPPSTDVAQVCMYYLPRLPLFAHITRALAIDVI